MRKPRLHAVFNRKALWGLSTLLQDEALDPEYGGYYHAGGGRYAKYYRQEDHAAT